MWSVFETILVELNRINVAVPLGPLSRLVTAIFVIYTCRIATEMRLSSSSECLEVLASHRFVILVTAVFVWCEVVLMCTVKSWWEEKYSINFGTKWNEPSASGKWREFFCLSEELLAPKEEDRVLVSYLVGKSVGQNGKVGCFSSAWSFLSSCGFRKYCPSRTDAQYYCDSRP